MSDDEQPNTLPCPFCGYNDTITELATRGKFGKFAKTMCQICGATVWGVGVMVPEDGGPADDLMASAIKAWNTRSEPREDRP